MCYGQVMMALRCCEAGAEQSALCCATSGLTAIAGVLCAACHFWRSLDVLVRVCSTTTMVAFALCCTLLKPVILCPACSLQLCTWSRSVAGLDTGPGHALGAAVSAFLCSTATCTCILDACNTQTRS